MRFLDLSFRNELSALKYEFPRIGNKANLSHRISNQSRRILNYILIEQFGTNVQDRAEIFKETIRQDYSHERVLDVTHGNINQAVILLSRVGMPFVCLPRNRETHRLADLVASADNNPLSPVSKD